MLINFSQMKLIVWETKFHLGLDKLIRDVCDHRNEAYLRNHFLYYYIRLLYVLMYYTTYAIKEMKLN